MLIVRIVVAGPPSVVRRSIADGLELPASDRTVGQEHLQTPGDGIVSLGIRIADEVAMPGERTSDRSRSLCDVGERSELSRRSQILERFEICVAESNKLGPTRPQLLLYGKNPQRHDECVEGMGDTAVSPIQEPVSTIADEDLRVVKIVMLNGLRDAASDKL